MKNAVCDERMLKNDKLLHDTEPGLYNIILTPDRKNQGWVKNNIVFTFIRELILPVSVHTLHASATKTHFPGASLQKLLPLLKQFYSQN